MTGQLESSLLAVRHLQVGRCVEFTTYKYLPANIRYGIGESCLEAGATAMSYRHERGPETAMISSRPSG